MSAPTLVMVLLLPEGSRHVLLVGEYEESHPGLRGPLRPGAYVVLRVPEKEEEPPPPPQ